jgi:hypothetical protein
MKLMVCSFCGERYETQFERDKHESWCESNPYTALDSKSAEVEREVDDALDQGVGK